MRSLLRNRKGPLGIVRVKNNNWLLRRDTRWAQQSEALIKKLNRLAGHSDFAERSAALLAIYEKKYGGKTK